METLGQWHKPKHAALMVRGLSYLKNEMLCWFLHISLIVKAERISSVYNKETKESAWPIRAQSAPSTLSMCKETRDSKWLVMVWS